MNTLQYQSHQNTRDMKLKIAQTRSAKTTKKLADEIIKKYNRGELQSHKTISQTSGLTHAIPRPICKINGWKAYTRFSYTANPEKRQLILEPCKDVSSNHTLVLCSDGKIKIGYNVCTLAGWEAGDAVRVALRGQKTIMERIKSAEDMQTEPKEQSEKINHVSFLGYFQFLPDHLIAKRNEWAVGTRFSCNTEDGRIVLEESADGNRKISGSNGNIGMISISKSICQQAKLLKCDPLKIDYEGRKIIIRRI